MSYTPGPWDLDRARGWIYSRPEPLKKVVIAQMESGTEDDHLVMTAAPDLLEALKPFAALAQVILGEAPSEADWITVFRSCTGERHDVTMDQLREACAAVAKAEGRL